MPRKTDDPRSPKNSDGDPHQDKRLRLTIGNQDVSYLPLFNDSSTDDNRDPRSSN